MMALAARANDRLKRLKTMIEDLGLTPGEFADEIGISRNTIYRILGDKGEPNLSTLNLICEKLGCSLDFALCKEKEDPSTSYKEAVITIRENQAQWTLKERVEMIKMLL